MGAGELCAADVLPRATHDAIATSAIVVGLGELIAQ
jgi:hypothetical protein